MPSPYAYPTTASWIALPEHASRTAQDNRGKETDMLSTKLTSAAVAASLALVPATRVAADGKDFIAGALLGGVAGAIIQNEVRKNKAQQRTRARTVTPQTYAAQPRAYVAPRSTKKTYRPSIPATQEGREIQSSLNYFCFNAGTVDGQVGSRTREAIGDYQAYLGYPRTGTLNAFEQNLLVTSYNRALAGGDQTFAQIASQPEGARGLLKVYRAEIASGAQQTAPAPVPAPRLDPTTHSPAVVTAL